MSDGQSHITDATEQALRQAEERYGHLSPAEMSAESDRVVRDLRAAEGELEAVTRRVQVLRWQQALITRLAIHRIQGLVT